MKRIISALAFALVSTSAGAQTPSTMAYGNVLTAGQWNALFASKQDYLGAPPLLTGGGTLSGRLVTAPSNTAAAGLNIPPGVAPTSPINGDLWTTALGIYVQVNGSTVGPLGSGGGGGGTLPVSGGGTGGSVASGTLLDNITGFSSTGFLTRTGSGTYAFQSLTNGIVNSNLAQAPSLSIKCNPTGGNATLLDCTGAQSEQLLLWTQSGAGAVQQTVDQHLKEEVRSSQFGFVCDGATDNTTAFTRAINQAIATSGLLRIVRDANNGYQCQWYSQIVVTAPDGAHNKIKIAVDPGIQMIWNGAQGGIQFNGQLGNGVTGGRLIPWIDGGYWYPYAAGGGWAIEMFAAWSGRVTNMIYNQQGTTSNRANVILMDNVFGGKIDGLSVYGCASAVLLRNATNGVEVSNGDIENCSTEGIFSGDNPIVAATNATTGTGSAILHFATDPHVLTGQVITDATNPSFITAGTTVASVSGTSVTMSANPTSTIGSGDSIHFNNSPSATNKLTGLYLEQLSNSIDIAEPGDSSWQVSDVFINQGGFLGGSAYDIHTVGSTHTVSGIVDTASVSTTGIHNDSLSSVFTNIVGINDSGISDWFFRNHTTAAQTTFCGSIRGTLPTGGFYTDASSAQNNFICNTANSNGTPYQGSITTNGYYTLPGGLIIQYGSISLNGTTPVTLTFPLQFPNNCWHVIGQLQNQQETFVATCASTSTGTLIGAAAGTPTAHYLAIGN